MAKDACISVRVDGTLKDRVQRKLSGMDPDLSLTRVTELLLMYIDQHNELPFAVTTLLTRRNPK